MAEHKHVADGFRKTMPLVYTAMSKRAFYYKDHVSIWVLKQGAVPLHPFQLFHYFFADALDRNVVRQANNNVVMAADEIWVFGPISDGIASEIRLAKEKGKPVRYFSLDELPERMVEIEREENLVFEKQDEDLGLEDLRP